METHINRAISKETVRVNPSLRYKTLCSIRATSQEVHVKINRIIPPYVRLKRVSGASVKQCGVAIKEQASSSNGH